MNIIPFLHIFSSIRSFSKRSRSTFAEQSRNRVVLRILITDKPNLDFETFDNIEIYYNLKYLV